MADQGIKTEIEVEVRLADIEQGWPKDGGLCAVALAFKRIFPEAGNNVGVEIEGAEVTINHCRLEYMLPDRAQEFIIHFDNDGVGAEPLMPIRFKAVLREYDNE